MLAAILIISFLIIYLAIVVWAFWPSSKEKFESIGRSVLNEDPPVGL